MVQDDWMVHAVYSRKLTVSQSVSVFVIQIVQGTPCTALCDLRVTPSAVSCQETLAPSPRLSWGHPIAREGRLYNTEPNLVVYF